jgi:hypothetical protein
VCVCVCVFVCVFERERDSWGQRGLSSDLNVCFSRKKREREKRLKNLFSRRKYRCNSNGHLNIHNSFFHSLFMIFLSSWGQFHQRSTHSFYVCKLCAQLFCAYVLGLYFTGASLLVQKLCVER